MPTSSWLPSSLPPQTRAVLSASTSSRPLRGSRLALPSGHDSGPFFSPGGPTPGRSGDRGGGTGFVRGTPRETQGRLVDPKVKGKFTE